MERPSVAGAPSPRSSGRSGCAVRRSSCATARSSSTGTCPAPRSSHACGRVARPSTPLPGAPSIRACSTGCPRRPSSVADRGRDHRLPDDHEPAAPLGHDLRTSGLIEPSPADEPVLEAFAAQLALSPSTRPLSSSTPSRSSARSHTPRSSPPSGSVAARIAHEIRNPVTAARSLAQLMERDPTAPGERRVGLAHPLRAGSASSATFRDLLRFARREEYASDPVDLGDLARDALGPFVPRLAAARWRSRSRRRRESSSAATARSSVKSWSISSRTRSTRSAMRRAPARPRRRAERDRATLRVTDSGRGILSDGAAAGLRAVLLDQGDRDRTRPRDRAAHHRCARRPHHRRAGLAARDDVSSRPTRLRPRAEAR